MPQQTKIMIKKKSGQFRNKVALCLKIWRKTKSIKETSKKTGINSDTVSSYLKCSEFYLKSKYNIKNISRKKLCDNKTIEEAIRKKHSTYRNYIAFYLRMWRKTRSVKKIANYYNIKPREIYYYLEQSKAYQKRYNFKNNCSTKDLRYIIRWSKKIKAINLMGKKCEKCGNTNIFNLDFHHKKPVEKTDKISNLLKAPWEKLRNEIVKCKLLCRNCHRETHNLNSKNKIAKQKLLQIKHEIKCSKCGYDKNLAALEFHHANKNKKINLFTKCSYRNNEKIKTDKILLKELNKCIILCSNCHNKIHNDKKQFNKLKHKIFLKILDYTD